MAPRTEGARSLTLNGMVEPPEGFHEVPATVFRKDDQLLVVTGEFVLAIRLHTDGSSEVEDFGPAPAGFEWTGEVRPPRKGEWFWSDLRGQVVQAIKDETGVNQFGQPTGGRKILRPVQKRPRPSLHLDTDE